MRTDGLIGWLISFVVVPLVAGGALETTSSGPKLLRFELRPRYETECAGTGVTMDLVAILHNQSARRVWVAFTVPELTYELEVVDAENQQVALTDYAKRQLGPMPSVIGWKYQHVEAGEDFEQKIFLDQLFVIARPGRYRVRAAMPCYLEPFGTQGVTPSVLKAKRHMKVESGWLSFCVK